MRRGVTALVALVLALAAVSACGRTAAPGVHWRTRLAWDGDVSAGWQDGARVGPLAAAVSPTVIAVADSFARRVLIWRRGAGGWAGPERQEVPAAAPLVALAADAAGGVVAADADGGVWAVNPGVAPRLLADLRPQPGELRRVLSIAAMPDGSAVAEVLTVTAGDSSRELLRIAPGAPPRPLLAASLASADPRPTPQDVRLMTPAGFRATLAPAGDGVWLAVRGPGAGPARVVRVGPAGKLERDRPLPAAVQRPGDFLGVDPGGRGYVLSGVGTAAVRLLVFDRSGRVQRAIPLSAGEGPRLPHPAAMSPDGAMLVMTAGPTDLQLDWWPAGHLPRVL